MCNLRDEHCRIWGDVGYRGLKEVFFYPHWSFIFYLFLCIRTDSDSSRDKKKCEYFIFEDC